MSEKIVFVSQISNQNIIKHKGATVVMATPGGTTSRVTPTSWIKFRNHKYVTDDSEEIEIIREHIKKYPRDRLTELIPKTPQDILREKEVEMVRLKEEMEEARKAAGMVEPIEEEKTTEEDKPDYKCPFCGVIRHDVKKMKRHCQNSHNRNVSLEKIEKEFLVEK